MIGKEKEFQRMMKEIKNLPQFQQKAIVWALTHWTLIEKLCEQEAPLSPEKFKQEIQRAIDTQDYAYYILLIYLKIMLGYKKEEEIK